MELRAAARTARRRPLGVVLALLCLLLAPVCQALCIEAPEAPVQAMQDRADCHGAAPEPVPGTAVDAECCATHAPTHSGTDRIEAPPPALATLWLPAIPEAVPAVRAPARLDPAAHAQGPPLRLLTLRFTE